MMLVEDVFVFLHSLKGRKSKEWSVYAGRVSMEDNVVVYQFFFSPCLLFFLIFYCCRWCYHNVYIIVRVMLSPSILYLLYSRFQTFGPSHSFLNFNVKQMKCITFILSKGCCELCCEGVKLLFFRKGEHFERFCFVITIHT